MSGAAREGVGRYGCADGRSPGVPRATPHAPRRGCSRAPSTPPHNGRIHTSTSAHVTCMHSGKRRPRSRTPRRQSVAKHRVQVCSQRRGCQSRHCRADADCRPACCLITSTSAPLLVPCSAPPEPADRIATHSDETHRCLIRKHSGNEASYRAPTSRASHRTSPTHCNRHTARLGEALAAWPRPTWRPARAPSRASSSERVPAHPRIPFESGPEASGQRPAQRPASSG